VAVDASAFAAPAHRRRDAVFGQHDDRALSDQPIEQKGFEHLAVAHALIEERMAGKTWVIGDRYSVVDPYLLVFYRWGNRMRIDMRQKYPAWTDHAHRMSERAAVKRALATEDVSIWG
jgi:glutathione S-transferase